MSAGQLGRESERGHAQGGHCNSRVRALGQAGLCLSCVPVLIPAASATLREITKLFEVSGSQEKHELQIGAQRRASRVSTGQCHRTEMGRCNAILTVMLFLGQLWF